MLTHDGHKQSLFACRLTITVEGSKVESLSLSVAVLIHCSSFVVFLSFVDVH